MIPMEAMIVKSAKDIEPGDIGLYFARGAVPFVAGLIPSGILCVAVFDADKTRVLDKRNLFGPAVVIAGAHIEVDPHSARKATLGSANECVVLAGANLYLELDYQMDLYQLAMGEVDETGGERVAFDRWRAVLRHGGTEFEILSRAPAAE